MVIALMNNIDVPDSFLSQIAQISMQKQRLEHGIVIKSCPLCNKQVTYGSAQESKNPIQHKPDCAWLLANKLILNSK